MSRIASLDGLRGVAILLVVLFHLGDYLPGAPIWLGSLLSKGWCGVYLFFVLSGFLIGNLVFGEVWRHGDLRVSRFWLRRMFRTWPLYFLLLAFFYRSARSISPPLVHYLTFTQNFFAMDFFACTWSLAVEEQFYLLLPLALWLLSRLGRLRLIPWLLSSAVIFAYIGRAAGFTNLIFAVADSLLVGVLISYLRRYRPAVLEPLLKHSDATAAVGLLVCAVSLASAPATLLLGGIALGFGLVLIAALDGGMLFSPFLSLSPLRYLALSSYGIYLTHESVLLWVDGLAGAYGLKGFARAGFDVLAGLSVSVSAGALLYRSIESPLLAFRDRFFPGR